MQTALRRKRRTAANSPTMASPPATAKPRSAIGPLSWQRIWTPPPFFGPSSGALSVPVAMPQVVRRITGHTAESPELEAWYTGQIQRLIQRLLKRWMRHVPTL